MSVLDTKQRKRSAVVKVGKQYKFPIPDAGHARAAIGRLTSAKPPLSRSQRAAVIERIRRFIPSYRPPKRGG